MAVTSFDINTQEYDALVFIEGDTIIAKNKYGLVISSGTAGTDDSTVIQAAIDSLSTAPGGTIILKSGTYYPTTTINLSNSVHLDSPGGATIQLPAAAAFTTFNSSSHSWKLYGLTIDGNGATASCIYDTSYGNGNNAIITKCSFSNYAADVIYLRTSNVTVEGCTFTSITGGGGCGCVHARDGNQWSIKGNVFTLASKSSSAANGVYLNYVSRCIVEANRIYGGFHNVHIRAGYGNVIANNTLLNPAGAGVEIIITDAINHLVISNYIQGGAERGIVFYDSPGGKVGKCHAIDNIVVGTTMEGIFSYGDYNKIIGNTVRNCGGCGIYLYGNYHTVMGNHCYDDQETRTQTTGIKEENGACDYNIIVGNTSQNNTTADYEFHGTHDNISNNIGYVNEGSGTATITADNAYVDVTHGIALTPTKFHITWQDNIGSRNYWVDNVGATTFRVNFDSADTVNHTFYWTAEV